MLKRFLLLTGVLVPLAVFSQPSPLTDPGSVSGIIRISEISSEPRVMHPAARAARGRGEQPSAFTGVTYTLQPNVKQLSPAQVNSMRPRMPQDGILDVSGQPIFRPSADSIYFDPQSDLVFQPLPIDDNQVLVLRPGLSKVFQDINLPRQIVPVRLANTTFTATDTRGRQVSINATGSNETYAVHLAFENSRYELIADKKDSLILTLNGEIIITNPRLEGQYTKSSGYAMIFRASEKINLKVETKMNTQRETEIPIWGTEIEAGNIGKCKLLLSMVIDVKGQVTLAAHIDQGIDVALGATGSTYWYMPTSVNKVAEVQHYCNIAYDVKTQLTAFAGLKAAADLKFKGYDVLDLYIKGGMEGLVETSGNELLADIGYRIKSGGKIISKKFTLVDHYTSLWKYQIANTAGFRMIVHEACAYGNYVAGEIFDIQDKPYTGSLELRIKGRDGNLRNYNATTNDKGVFLAKDIPLQNGEKVSIKVPGSPSYSSEVATTIPFKEISLLSADYFTETATVMVAASKSEWAQMAGSPTPGRTPSALTARPGLPGQTAQASGIGQGGVIDYIKNFRDQMVLYSGPVTFWVKDDINQRARREDAFRGNINKTPMGLSKVTGLGFKPAQWVQARIDVGGFVITSDWVLTEGLMISTLEHSDLTVSTSLPTRSEKYGSSNSFIIISAMDGNRTPTGQVTMLRGFDAPHSSPSSKEAISHFPEAQNAVILFNRSISLEPLTGYPGVAISNTGSWETTVAYRSPDFVLPVKNGKHHFEKVSYSFKGKDLGYQYFIRECHSCTSPINMVESISKNRNFMDAVRSNPGMAPAPQVPSTRPGGGIQITPTPPR
jgi:hypothetical protein